MKKRLFKTFIGLVVLFSSVSVLASENSLIPPQKVKYKLVKLVNKCVYAEKNHQSWPRFCSKVSVRKDTNYSILNSRDGLAKLLFLPNDNIHGVEDSILFSRRTPSYFNLAWENRFLMNKKLAKRLGQRVNLEDRDYLFSVNATQSRTQDRLHIHMTCMKKEYKRKFSDPENIKQYTFDWKKLPFTVENPFTKQAMNFVARKVTINDVRKGRLHRMIQGLAGERYPNFGIALWPLDQSTFLLMVTDDPVLAAPNRILADPNCAFGGTSEN